MKALEAVLLVLRANAEIEAGDGVSSMPVGRTAMQKIVYLASPGISVDAAYYAHYYGPFSEDVAGGLARLWGFGYVHESSPTCDYPGYAYSLTKDGDRLGTKVAKDGNLDDYAKIKAVVQTCRDFCGLRQMPLAYAAKTHYVKRRNNAPRADVGRIISMACKAGWDLTRDNVSTGQDLLCRLGLDKQ